MLIKNRYRVKNQTVISSLTCLLFRLLLWIFQNAFFMNHPLETDETTITVCSVGPLCFSFLYSRLVRCILFHRGIALSFHLQYLPLSVKRQCRLVSTELCRAAQWGVEGETWVKTLCEVKHLGVRRYRPWSSSSSVRRLAEVIKKFSFACCNWTFVYCSSVCWHMLFILSSPASLCLSCCLLRSSPFIPAPPSSPPPPPPHSSLLNVTQRPAAS